MKVFIAVLMIAALVHADDGWKVKTVDEIKAFRAECSKEHPLDPEVITQLKIFEYPDTEAVRQYLLCILEKMDIFCSHEGWHIERLAKQWNLDESEELAIVEGCIDKNEQASPDDVWAFRGHKCVLASKIGDRIKTNAKKRIEEAAKST